MLRALARAWLAASVTLLVISGSAQAAITDSSITSPADPSYFVYNTNAPGTIAVTGTVTGSGNVDLVCYWGTLNHLVLAGIVPTGSTFSANPSRSLFPAQTCVLRAVPAGTTPSAPPGSPSPFAGPLVAASSYEPNNVATGPNAGRLIDFTLTLPQRGAADTLMSTSGCGQTDGALLNLTTLAQLPDLWACVDYLWWQDRQNGGATRSQLQVDGVNHYLGYGPTDLYTNSNQTPGLPEMTADYTQDPATGDLKLTEHEGTVTCASNTYPPTSASCASFAPGAVAIDRTTTVDHQGTVTRITTTVRDVAHQAHHLDLQFEQDQAFPAPGVFPTFEFPGQSAFATHADGDTIAFPASTGPATIFAKPTPTTTDGDDGQPKGSVTVMPSPADAHFYDPHYYHLDYAVDIPADGSATFDAVYALAPTLDGAKAAAGEGSDRIGSPVVTIGSPAEGATVTAAAQTFSGTAVDVGGAVKSFTVNGQAVTVAPDGTWSTSLTLAQGPNAITAIATDAFGNTGSATRNVTFTPLPAPAKDTTPPLLSALSMSPRSFAVGPGPTPVAVAASARGATVRWTVSEAGTTTFAFKRLVSGRKKGSRCVTGKAAPRRGRRCTRDVAAGSLRRTGAAGNHVLKFSGRIGKRALARGPYRMDVTAADAAGNRSKKKSITFTIARR